MPSWCRQQAEVRYLSLWNSGRSNQCRPGVPQPGSRAAERASAILGHSALITDATAPDGACAPCLPSREMSQVGWGGLAASPHRITAFSPSRIACASYASGHDRLRPCDCCGASRWRRFRAIPPEQPESDHIATSSHNGSFAPGVRRLGTLPAGDRRIDPGGRELRYRP